MWRRRARWQRRRLPAFRSRYPGRGGGRVQNVLFALFLLLVTAMLVSLDLPATQRAEEYITYVLTQDMELPVGSWTGAWERLVAWTSARWDGLVDTASRLDNRLDEVRETLGPAGKKQ